MRTSRKKGIVALFLVFAMVLTSSMGVVWADPPVNPLFVPAEGIDMTSPFPASMSAGSTVSFYGVVYPSSATNTQINWSVSSGSIGNNQLTAPMTAGTITVTAIVFNGTAQGNDLVRTFSINVTAVATPITTVHITNLAAPVTGSNPSTFVATTTDGVNVSVHEWRRQSGGNWIVFSGAFNPGAVYRVELNLSTTNPAGFASNLDLTGTGGTVSGSNALGAMSITRFVQFPATAGALINNVTITGLTAPVAGNHPVHHNNVGATQSGVDVDDVIWYRRTGTNNWNTFSGSFQDGNVYRARLVIFANQGFTANANVTAAGSQSVTGTNAANVTTIERFVQFPATTDGTIAITGLTAPVPGAAPVNHHNVNTNQSGVNVTNVQWQRNTGGNNWTNHSGNFVAGTVYRAVLTITTNASQGFAANQTFTAVNSSSVTGNNSSGVTSTTRYVQFPMTVGAATITGLTAPATGNTPVGHNVVNAGADGINFNVTQVRWQRHAGGNNWTNMTGVFTVNSTYRAVLTITTPNPGFNVNQVFTAAGAQSVTGTNTAGATSITRYVQFPVTGIVDTLVISGLTPPVTGAMPVTTATASGGATVVSIQWQRDIGGGTMIGFSGPFTAGSVYVAVLTISHPNGFGANIQATAAGSQSVTGTNNAGATPIIRNVQFPATVRRGIDVTPSPITFNAVTGITINGVPHHVDHDYWGAFEINADGVSVLPARLAFSLLFNNIDPYNPNIFVWNAAASSFTIDPNGHNIVFQVGNTTMNVGGMNRTIMSGTGAAAFPYAPYVNPANSRLMLPLRAFADALDLTVHWNPQTSTVTLTP